jgi:hypothetical protein
MNTPEAAFIGIAVLTLLVGGIFRYSTLK